MSCKLIYFIFIFGNYMKQNIQCGNYSYHSAVELSIVTHLFFHLVSFHLMYLSILNEFKLFIVFWTLYFYAIFKFYLIFYIPPFFNVVLLLLNPDGPLCGDRRGQVTAPGRAPANPGRVLSCAYMRGVLGGAHTWAELGLPCPLWGGGAPRPPPEAGECPARS